jgi:nucleoside-diphosphate-sugar epimerase
MINLHMIEAARINGAERFLFSSSACVYPMYLQQSPDVTNLKEEDAYPAEPEEGYGTEKLFMEEMCKYYREDYGFQTRVVRFHNVYGELGTYEGGKEKAPAAICRKLALAADGDEIEVWGDGHQTRSLCTWTTASRASTASCTPTTPTRSTSGTDELVTVNQLVDLVARDRRQGHRQSATTSPSLKASGAATATTTGSARRWLGAPDTAERRPCAHLPVDRVGAQGRQSDPRARLGNVLPADLLSRNRRRPKGLPRAAPVLLRFV